MWTVAVAGVLFYLPDLVVGFLGSRRKQAIFLALPDALDLMVVCVEAGLGLDQAMRKVADEMKQDLSRPGRGVRPVQLPIADGPPASRSAPRTGRADRRGRPARPGGGADPGRQVRLQHRPGAARRKATRCASAAGSWPKKRPPRRPCKLIFPLVLFIFPGIFVILVGPAAITMVREMFPILGAGN